MNTYTKVPQQIILSDAQKKELESSKKELEAGNFKDNAALDREVRDWLKGK